VILPSDAGNPSAIIVQSLNIYKHIFRPSSPKGGSPHEEAEEADQPSVVRNMQLRACLFELWLAGCAGKAAV
jgi:hypothetical protein